MSDEGQPSMSPSSDEGAPPPAPPSAAETPTSPSAPPPPDMSGDTPPPPPPPDMSGDTPPPPPPPDMSGDTPPPPDPSGYGSVLPPPPGADAPAQAQPDDSQPGYTQPDPSQPAYGAPGADQQGYAPAPPPAVQPMANMAGAGVAEDTSSAVIAQVLALFTGILGTGIFYAVSNDKSPFVRHHAAEALNFSITLTGAYLVTGITLIGLVLWPFLILWGIIMPIIAAMAANRGEWYKYPATLRLIKGPLDQPGGVQGSGGQSY